MSANETKVETPDYNLSALGNDCYQLSTDELTVCTLKPMGPFVLIELTGDIGSKMEPMVSLGFKWGDVTRAKGWTNGDLSYRLLDRKNIPAPIARDMGLLPAESEPESE